MTPYEQFHSLRARVTALAGLLMLKKVIGQQEYIDAVRVMEDLLHLSDRVGQAPSFEEVLGVLRPVVKNVPPL